MSTALEDQLSEARAQVETLTRDHQAKTELLDEASANVDSLRGEVGLLTAEIVTLKAERDSVTGESAAMQTRITELQASQADFDRKLQLEVARVVASTGTTLPARITPAGDHQQAPQANSLQELVAQYDRLVTAKQPEEAAAFYEQNLAKHFNR